LDMSPVGGSSVFGTINRLMSLATITAAIAAQQAVPSKPSKCDAAGKIVRLEDLPEASGVAASRRTPGVFWAHNDSGEPVIVALDAKGTIKGRVRVSGATVDDWEDIAVGPCPQGGCLYIADIGDNSGSRKRITLYRVPEPAPDAASTSPAEAFHAAYPDGAHDAESLFVTPEADVFLITKGDPGPVALYRFPRPLASGTALQLLRIGEPVTGSKTSAGDRPTGADVSPDGGWVAVRTTDWVAFHRTTDLVAGRWREAFRSDLRGLGEPRGEGVTYDGDDLILVGEGGSPFGGQGTFARLSCTPGR
jgi:hypothetical protein